MADREKEGKIEIQKFEYLENEKSFLDEIKSIFHSFWRVIIWWKNKKYRTQALNSLTRLVLRGYESGYFSKINHQILLTYKYDKASCYLIY